MARKKKKISPRIIAVHLGTKKNDKRPYNTPTWQPRHSLRCDWTIFLGGQNKLHNGRVVRSDTATSTFILYYQTLIRPRRIATSHRKKTESKNCFFRDLLFNHHRSPWPYEHMTHVHRLLIKIIIHTLQTCFHQSILVPFFNCLFLISFLFAKVWNCPLFSHALLKQLS